MKSWLGLLMIVSVGGVFARSGPIDREGARLRLHFDSVLVELRTADVSALAPAQRAARATHIARLAAYAARGVFPKNTDFADAQVPYFIDRDGRRCAMAYLIEQSGAGDYVRAVSTKMNNAYVPEIGRDTALGATLHAWLDANGLTEAEAARIQPSYGDGGCCTIPDDPPPPQVTTAYKVGSGAAITTGVATTAINVALIRLAMSRRTSGVLGVAAGAFGIGLAATAGDDGDAYKTLRLANGGVGAVALAIGIYTFVAPDKKPTRTGSAQHVAVTPYVPSGGGLALNLAF
jgi:hypothetical protein